jgi:serine/threonine protein kinase
LSLRAYAALPGHQIFRFLELRQFYKIPIVMGPDLVRVADDGSIELRGKMLSFPNLRATEVIGRGANGIVIRAAHKYLDRQIAVKVWLSLREGDSRDKFYQGIEEAKKMAGLPNIRNIVRIYDAGEIEGFFYATMDYYPGVTLRAWLNDHNPSLLRRRNLASGLLHTFMQTIHEGAFHGDPHHNNILVRLSDDDILEKSRSQVP